MDIQEAAKKVSELQLGLLADFGTEEYTSASNELHQIWKKFDKQDELEALIQEVDKLAKAS